MIRSLRFRILAWYAVSLTLTVTCFGGVLYWRMRESKISAMDLELRGAGQSMLAALNALHEFDFQWDKPLGTVPDLSEIGPPPGGGRRGGRGRGGPGGPGFGGSGFGGGPGGFGFDEPPPRREGQSRNPPEQVLELAPLRRRPELEGSSEAKPNAVSSPEAKSMTPNEPKADEQTNPQPPQGQEDGPRPHGGPGGRRGFPGDRHFGDRGPGQHGPGGYGPGDHGHGEFGPGKHAPGEFGFREGGPGDPLRDVPPEEIIQEFQRKAANVALPANFERSVESTEGEKPYFAVWRENGSVMKATSVSPPQGLHVAKQLNPTTDGVIRSFGDYREIWIAGPHNSVVLVRRKAAKLYCDLAQWLLGIVGIGVGVLVVGVAGGWWMSYGVLKSIRAMNLEVSRLSEQNLSQRVGLRGVDTELKGLGQTLNRTFARLEAAFDRQRQFTGDASHELRTPLTVVMGNLELALQDEKLRPEAKRSLEAALRAAKRMRGLTDQLLTLARADAGALELKRSEFDLGDIVQECADLVRPMANKKNIHLEVNAPSTEIEGDAGLLSQVVINLLSNAIQYNKTGGNVHVDLSNAGPSVQLQVTDTGVGIPEEARSRLFERFYRPDGSRNRQSGGNGLGLAISKSLVEAHGGKITFDSAVGTGTEFRVLLPRC